MKPVLEKALIILNVVLFLIRSGIISFSLIKFFVSRMLEMVLPLLSLSIVLFMVGMIHLSLVTLIAAIALANPSEGNVLAFGGWNLVSIVILLVIVVVIGLLLFSLIVLLKMSRPNRNTIYEWTPDKSGLEYEEFTVKSRDGTELVGWFIKGGGKGPVIVAHGYTSNMGNGSYMKTAIEGLVKKGFDVATFDFRAHGRSKGTTCTVGVRESWDLETVIDWVLDKTGKDKVALVGYSMGAMTAIIVGSRNDKTAVVVADSPPPGLPQSIERGLKVFAGLPGWLAPLVKMWGGLLYGFNPDEYVMWKLAEKSKAHLMVVVGTKDVFITVDEAKKIVEAARKAGKDAELFIVEGAEHVKTVEHPEYVDRISSFIEKHL